MSAPSAHATLIPREVVLADFIPFSSHVTDRVIRTREGDYIQIWKVPGLLSRRPILPIFSRVM